MSRIRAVVVNFNGGARTLECVRTLLAAMPDDDELSVVLVDNGSDDGVAETVRTELPDVDVRRSPVNLGFAGGCNLALTDLDGIDHVALVNNDVTVAPGWLGPLRAALDDDDRLGAACPKMLLEGRYRALSLDVETHRAGPIDGRELGVRVHAASSDPQPPRTRAHLVSGFWGLEPAEDGEIVQWTRDRAELLLPATDADVQTVRLRLGTDRLASVSARSEATVTNLVVPPGIGWYDVLADGVPFDVVNNVGSCVRDDGYGVDRGWLEPDRGQYDSPEDVQAWCGGAVLLRADYLRDVGLFDDRLFLYYEDLELSLRGAEKGWRYRFVPSSTVRHDHASTSGAFGGLTLQLNERNRLLVMARHRAGRDVARAVGRYLLSTASYARRDVLAPLLRGRRPSTAIVGRRLRAFAGFLRLAPAMTRDRDLPAP